jgi:uncharacterized membrane protein YjfL (UPF0719 family)
MNELIDKLLIKIGLSLFICATIILYKYAHLLLYPATKEQVLKRFYPSRNGADTIHFFSRIIGIGIIFSGLNIELDDNIWPSLLAFLIKSVWIFIIYLVSIFLMESISLFNFEYYDEIMKRKNLSYAIISFTQSICLAFIISAIMKVTNNSLLLILFLWPFAIVIFGIMTKLYKVISNFNFNQLIISKNLAVAYSFSGFQMGVSIIVVSSLKQEFKSIESYAISVILQIMLASIIFPIFQKGLVKVFNIHSEMDPSSPYYSVATSKNSSNEMDRKMEEPSLGIGIFEGCFFLTTSLLTSLITGHVFFGNFYPVF